MSGVTTLAPRRRVSIRHPRVTPLFEFGVLVLAVAIGVATYFIVRGGQSLLTPPIIALLLIVNLAPSVGLIVLLGRRIAQHRAAISDERGEGKLHVRLVAWFSMIATVPTVLAVIFASVTFQYGVEFWLSDRVAAVMANATKLASVADQKRLSETVGRWDQEALATARDLAANFKGLGTTTDTDALLRQRDPEFGYPLARYFALQTYSRNLSESALFTIKDGNNVQFIARLDPYGNVAEQIDPVAVAAVLKGEPSVVTVNGNRIRILTLIPGSEQVFLYVGRVTDAPVVDNQAQRVAEVVSADFRSLQSRARVLQLQFNAALFIVALLIVGVAVWIALMVADRIVRPIDDMVGAARRVADGDLTARVAAPRSDDEVGTLAEAFNAMTGRLEAQTGALERRRALIEAVMSGVSAGVISVGGDGTIRLINASAAGLLKLDEETAVGMPLGALSPDLAEMLAGDTREAIVELTAGTEKRTLAVRVTADNDGRVLTFDDITQQLLDQRRAAWSDVARRIAHEIKNPLTPIQLAAERLQRRYGKTIEAGDTIFGQLTDTIVRQVGDLRRMVDEFSSFARMPKPVFHQESLIDLTRQAVFLHEIAHPAIRFTLTAPDAVPLVCDRRQIGQALTNIIKNAVEAIEARGEGLAGMVAVKLALSDRQATVEVADDGIGLPIERDRIVEPYMTTRARGTGLGLAIVKKIIEEHCGTIAFADRPGGGTVVTIMFDTNALEALLHDSPEPADISQSEGTLAMLTRTGQKP